MLVLEFYQESSELAFFSFNVVKFNHFQLLLTFACFVETPLEVMTQGEMN